MGTVPWEGNKGGPGEEEAEVIYPNLPEGGPSALAQLMERGRT